MDDHVAYNQACPDRPSGRAVIELTPSMVGLEKVRCLFAPNLPKPPRRANTWGGPFLLGHCLSPYVRQNN